MTVDPILFWNEVALETHRRDFTPADAEAGGKYGCSMDRQTLDPEQGGPTRTSRALAMVHLSMYDAFKAIRPEIGGQAYLPNLPLPPVGASVEAAVAGAARTVLVALFGRQASFIQSKQIEFLQVLEQGGAAALALAEGLSYGRRVGLAMLEARRDDGSDLPQAYEPLGAPGTFAPDPYAPHTPALHPRWGEVAPFGLPDLDQLHYVPPLGHEPIGAFLGDPRWPLEVEEVRRLGAAQDYADLDLSPGDRSRIAEEMVIGIFWGYDGARGIGTPPRLYNQCVRAIAEQEGLSPEQNVVLFALVNMAMADAGIAAWEEKYRYHVWRPVQGVREAAKGFGVANGISDPTFAAGDLTLPLPAAYADVEAWLATPPSSPTTAYGANHGDPLWRPLGAPQTNMPASRQAQYRTPPFPAYPSGHATFGTACFAAVREYLVAAGVLFPEVVDTLPFKFVSDEFNGRSTDPDGSVRPRHHRSLTLAQAIHENAVSRIYLGVHFRMDAVEGVRLGSELLTAIAANARGPAAILPKPATAAQELVEMGV